ncbi:hypothetical protein J5TS2_36440 [Brevibacillus halotolerans]|uniref:YopX family protein n=1 Tax=Brevibacillus halotolerans TaxID=1507437 RepID=UPI001B2A6E64|nr:YopX family protein [Brevibacillus halotolerans]GIO02976.1 hypothetical protein J5TS2_36440 [Brevibacillus halotolerans]
MREIKFRAWDKEDKYMLDWEMIKLDVEYSLNQLLEMNRFDIMQFTGLHDKNGKEIYEGDIIKRNFEIGRVVINPISLGAEDYEIDDSGYFIGVVSYRPSEGYVLNKCKKFNDDDELQSKKSGVKIYPNHAEVIGNIYENPDLLGV